jgi:hypothetical protein
VISDVFIYFHFLIIFLNWSVIPPSLNGGIPLSFQLIGQSFVFLESLAFLHGITLSELPFSSANLMGKKTNELGGETTRFFPFLLRVSWVKHPVSWGGETLEFLVFFCDFSWVKQPVSWGGETTRVFPFLLR